MESHFEDGPFIVFENLETGNRGYAQYKPETDYTRNWQKAVVYKVISIVTSQKEARKLVWKNDPVPAFLDKD